MKTTLEMPRYGGSLPKTPLVDLSRLDPLDVAWAAGFIDGEGAIMISKTWQQITLVLQVSQSTSRSLDKLAMMFGGSVKLNKRGVHEWRQYGIRAGHTIGAIKPFLVEKAEHAEIAVHFVENCLGPKWSEKEECYNKMIPLQKKRFNNGRAFSSGAF